MNKRDKGESSGDHYSIPSASTDGNAYTCTFM